MDAINRIEGKKEMRQETVKTYKFNELSEKVQQEVIDGYRWIAVEDSDWWESIADEIKEQGGDLVQFDIYKGTIQMDIVLSPIEFAKAIVANHGSSCHTYIISEDFINGEMSGKEYVEAISEQYLSILRQEYEYLTSDEYVRMEIIDMDEEYFEDGTGYQYGRKI